MRFFFNPMFSSLAHPMVLLPMRWENRKCPKLTIQTQKCT